MSWEDEDVTESRERLAREIATRRKRGEALEVLVAPKGSAKLCRSFWAQAWCRHLEAYSQYEARLPRGRSRLRAGAVHDLRVEPGALHAVVAGGGRLHETCVRIRPVEEETWREITTTCAGQADSLLDLLAGRVGEGMLKVLTDPEDGLFPKPREIRFDCDCPDHANLCEHAAALLYGVAVRMDAQPELLFTLRGVDPARLLGMAGEQTAAGLDPAAGDLEGVDLEALFGIQLGGNAPPPGAHHQ